MTPTLTPLACHCLLCGAPAAIAWQAAQLRYICQACGWIRTARLANIVIGPDIFPVLVAGGGTAPTHIERRAGSAFTARVALTAGGEWQWVNAVTPVVGRCGQCGRAVVHHPIRHRYQCTSQCFGISDRDRRPLPNFLATPPEPREVTV